MALRVRQNVPKAPQ